MHSYTQLKRSEGLCGERLAAVEAGRAREAALREELAEMRKVLSSLRPSSIGKVWWFATRAPVHLPRVTPEWV